MEFLWLAIVIYTIGLGVVLHLRPALMFNENGSWKEFGYQRNARYTIFPFWLFVIAWAIVSYALAASGTLLWATPALAMMGPEEEEEPDQEIETPRRPRGRPRKKPRQGYYMLEPESEESGVRRYVYYGEAPPEI
jgi:hypothetical protein